MQKHKIFDPVYKAWFYSRGSLMAGRVAFKGAVGAVESPYNEELAELAKQQYEETTPLREAFMGDWLNTMQGGAPKFTGTMYAGLKQPLETQYDVAKENIISSLPQGGALQNELANLETARAQGLQSVLDNIWADQLAKAYGYMAGAPQTAIAGLGTAAGIGTQAAGTAAQIKASNEQAMMGGITSGVTGCMCFNFMVLEGGIDESVRKYRDSHYPKNGIVSNGYGYMSTWLIPLLKKFPWLKKPFRAISTRPLIKYADWFYKKNRYGWVCLPFKWFWVGIWGIFGAIMRDLGYKAYPDWENKIARLEKIKC